MKKFLWIVFLLLLLSSLIFYFWASNNALDEVEYTQLIDYPAKPVPYKDTLSIITFNIGYLSGMTNNQAIKPNTRLNAKNHQRTIDLFREYQPDMVVFQEIDFDSYRSFNNNQLRSIGEFSNFDMGAMAINWDKNYVPFPYGLPSTHYGKILSGQGVLSKYPIISNERLVLKKADNPFYYNAFYLERLLQITKIDIGDTELIVMNVHLEAYNKEARQNQAKYVLDTYRKYASTYPVILLGDFNAEAPYCKDTQDSLTLSYFLDEPHLNQAITQMMYEKAPSTFFTFNSDTPFQKIDYIFYSSDKIQSIDAKVLHDFGEISDHLPVLMRFTLTDML